MARKAKPVWFKPKGGKWHRERLSPFIMTPPSDVFTSKCGRYHPFGDWKLKALCKIRRSKPKDNVCKHCNR